ncbi:F-box protein At5g07610-like [Rhododendron vialii]|uniref:F-box protein At5g07610-like n=1 Tax=Rhododendron vialii TaxID=182163 RepID=UPI00265EE3F9|nr:F-box protein At5g07610-like [Rhododendron vialii]
MSKKRLLLSLTCSAEIIAGNVDLLTQILLRVPAKSLIRFKSVSKQWLSLISDSRFARIHTQQNPSPPISGLYFYFNHDSSLSLNRITRVSFCDDHRRTTLPNLRFLDGSGAGILVLHHSSNGLMLWSNGDQIYLVCNPTTQKFVVLPTLAAVASESKFRYLIYDPRKSHYYKVVVVRSSYHKNTSQFDVYSSESGSWKSSVAAPWIPNHWSGNGFVWNGAIFQMTCVPGPESCCSKHDHVYFRFDIDAGKLTTTRVPSSPDTNISKEILCFGERGGHLFHIQVPWDKATEFRVLEMMERENDYRWTVKYVVDLTPLILPQGRVCTSPERRRRRFLVISIMNVGASENDLAVVLYFRGEFVQYNIESKSWKVLSDLPLGRNFPACISHDPKQYSHPFIQSLTPI